MVPSLRKFTVRRDPRKTVLRTIICCGSLGEGKMNSAW